MLKFYSPSQVIILPKWIIVFIYATFKIFKNYFIVVQLQLSAFSPYHSTPHPSQTHSLPCFHPPSLGFVHVSFIVVPEKAFKFLRTDNQE